MNKWITLGSLFVIMAGLSNLTAAYKARPIVEIVSISDLNSDKVNNFFSGKSPEMVMEFPAGSILPLNIQLKGEFLALDTSGNAPIVKILQTIFVKRDKTDFYFSKDLQNWKNFQDFTTGLLSLSLNVYESSPEANLMVELNQR